MPAQTTPEQQQPMAAVAPMTVVDQQPTAEPQPQPQAEVGLRGGFMEECGCCCFEEEVACC